MALTPDNISGESPLELDVEAFAGVEATRSTIPALRKKLHNEDNLSPSLLKYADEQTVVSLAAILNTIQDFGLQDRPFSDWGVVAGPRFLGRETLTRVLDKFHLQGALGASPLITPYLSLHAVSGPNLGVGGGKGSMAQALLTGLAMQQEQSLPGVWVVVSEWEPEPIPGDDSQESPQPVCRAACLGLVPATAGRNTLKLRLFPQGAPDNLEGLPQTVAGLVQFLAFAAGPKPAQNWSCPLPGNGRLELTTTALAESHVQPARAA